MNLLITDHEGEVCTWRCFPSLLLIFPPTVVHKALKNK